MRLPLFTLLIVAGKQTVTISFVRPQKNYRHGISFKQSSPPGRLVAPPPAPPAPLDTNTGILQPGSSGDPQLELEALSRLLQELCVSAPH